MTAMPLEKFRDLPREKQLAVHEEMKNTLGIEGILKKWDLTRSKYYYMIRKLKLNDNNETEGLTNNNNEETTPKKLATDKIASLDFEEPLISMDDQTKEQMPLSLSVQGSPKLVGAIMKSLEDMFHNSSSNYSVNITIKEG